jgi:hypothetical protein
MLESLIALIDCPDDYVARWRNGELFIEPAAAATKDDEKLAA